MTRSEAILDIHSIKRTIAGLVKSGAVDQRVVDQLTLDGKFVPKETELWDYKERAGCSRSDAAKTILQICSLYNSHGGYLVYGVKEVKKDAEFILADELESLKVAQIRQLLRNYTGTDIDFTYRELDVELNNMKGTVGLLHVPKRSLQTKPVAFIKQGPDKSNGRPLFDLDTVYFRDSDQCKPATERDDFVFLGGPRHTIFDAATDQATIPHNLPDKALVCPTFVGRTELIKQLWRWLGDDFQYAKLLSGAGGLGKTSIAYEFAREVVSNPPYGFERLIWLTAKKKQFSAFDGKYRDVPETHFFDVESLLSAVCSELAILDTETAGSGILGLKKLLRSALREIPTLVIIDDVDSLEPGEQRTLLDTARQIADANGKFLLTTRANPSFSEEQSVHVPGLDEIEYKDLVVALCKRLQLADINGSQVKKLHAATEGSPLLTESIFRLMKLGEPLANAIDEWRGGAGEAARNAVLKREVEQLSPEGRRVLLAAALMRSCSATELRQATGYDNLQLSGALEELQALFLISAPRFIEKEPRFEMSEIATVVVLDHKTRLAYDHRKIEETIKRLRSGNKYEGKVRKRKLVGQAINQARAMLGDGDVQGAIDTIGEALKSQPSHPDLLVMKGQCCLNDPSRLNEARKLFRKAFELGQRKELLFSLWYKAEDAAKSGPGAIEVSEKALQNDNVSDQANWRYRLARGCVVQAGARNRAKDTRGALEDYIRASCELSQAIRSSSGYIKSARIQEAAEVNDAIWSLALNTTEFLWSEVFDAMAAMIKRGDIRTVNYERLVESLEEMVLSQDKIQPDSGFDRAVRQRIAATKDLIASRSQQDKEDRPFDDLQDQLIAIQEMHHAKQFAFLQS